MNMANFTIVNSNVSKNVAMVDSSFLFALNNQVQNLINVNYCYIHDNTAGSNTIYLIYTFSNIKNTYMIDNVASTVNNGITLISS